MLEEELGGTKEGIPVRNGASDFRVLAVTGKMETAGIRIIFEKKIYRVFYR